MRHLTTYKLFEAKYSTNEYIDTDILLDVLGELTEEKDILIDVNKTSQAGVGYRESPKFSFGEGYLKDEFGVYSFKFILNDTLLKQNYTHTSHLWEKLGKALKYYYDQTGNRLIFFNRNDPFIQTDEQTAGDIKFIEVYFAREDIMKRGVSSQFTKNFSFYNIEYFEKNYPS